MNYSQNTNKYKKGWINSIKWKWKKSQDNGKIDWDPSKIKLDNLKTKIILFKIKSENLFKKNKDSDYNIFNNKLLSELEWRIKRLKDMDLNFLLFNLNSDNYNKPDKDT